MNIWQRFTNWLSSLFTKKPTLTNAAPGVPAPTTPAPAPAPAPTTPAEPPSFALIRALISKWRGWNMEWKTIGYNLQTSPGLGRALTPAEWEVAYAAGFPRELNAVVVDTGPSASEVTAPSTLKYVQGGRPLVVGEIADGVPFDMIGNSSKKIVGGPARYRVTTMITSDYASTYTVRLNGAVAGTFPPDQSVHDTYASGPDLDVSIEQEAGSHIMIEIHAA